MPDLPDPVQLAVPGFIALMIAEMLFVRWRGRGAYEKRDTLTSLLLGTGSTVAGALTAGLVLALAFWLWQHRLFDIGWAWWAWPLCFVLDDLAYFFSHWFMHRVRWGWASHVIHHSSQHYNLSTALRQTWTGFFSLTWAFRLPLFLLGFHPAMVFFCAGLNLYIRAQGIRRLYILNRFPWWAAQMSPANVEPAVVDYGRRLTSLLSRFVALVGRPRHSSTFVYRLRFV